MAEFKLPPISTLAGTTIPNYLRALRQGRVEFKYILKTIISGIIILIGTPFRWYERIKYTRLIGEYQFKEEPVFILGHWRSGTTLLHNLLCMDPRAGYLTTYHSLFPHYLGSKWLFKNFMRIAMPKHRPSDGLELSVDYPQEEEFCIGNINPWSYYYFLYFPEHYKEFYEKYVRFNDVTTELREQWMSDFRDLVIKATINSGGERAIFKNPVNTGRVRELVEIFPQARFVDICRNPVIVYLSSKKFFLELFPTLYFQHVSEDEVIKMIVETYVKINKDLLNSISLIPAENYYQIKFEDFEKSPVESIEDIYAHFRLPNYHEAEPLFKTYFESKKGHKKNVYTIKRTELDLILDQWDFAMKHWNYSVPDNLKIVDE